jgi:hypothetical protein
MMEQYTFESDQAYLRFLSGKKKVFKGAGFEAGSMSTFLFDFQEYITRLALRNGRFAVFADCGLGKTLMQLEWAKLVSIYLDKPALILAPLSVVGQTLTIARIFGYNAGRYGETENIQVTNYEQIDNIDASLFCGVALDESSILKNFEGAFKKKLIEKFRKTEFRSCWTATPSPNDDMEICNHAEFLGVGTRNEILATYFTHDGGETSKWRLKGHAIDRFWEFVSSWSIMVSNPSDIGFDGSKYILPDINYINIDIVTPVSDPYKIVNDTSVSATNFNSELRKSMEIRLDRVAEIVNNSDENFIVWIRHDAEGDYLRKLIPDAIEVKGTDKPDVKEKHLLGFSKNEFRVLITKTKIAQFGLNYQNCRNQIFASLDFSFEGLYQAIRRSYRFGQKNTVNIYLIVTDTMGNVIASIKRKEQQYINMKNKLKQYAKV